MTYLINQLIFVLINILNAANDNAKIKNKKTVDHLLNGIAYSLAIIVFIMIFRLTWIETGIFGLSCFTNRQLFFDIPLNLMRKLKWDYVSPDPGSWLDKQEKKIFGNNGRKPAYIYGVIFLATIFVNLIFDL